jgi:hypothetical protein
MLLESIDQQPIALVYFARYRMNTTTAIDVGDRTEQVPLVRVHLTDDVHIGTWLAHVEELLGRQSNGFESRTAAIHARSSEEKRPDPVAGRFESGAPETLAHSTIGRWSPHRCRPCPRSRAEFDRDGVIHAPSSIADSALADISDAALRSMSVALAFLSQMHRFEAAAFARRSAIAEYPAPTASLRLETRW